MPLLSVENLKARYIVKNGVVNAVDGISFSVKRGECLGIAGESGCGKTTLALSLMGLLKGGKVTSGRVLLDEASLLDLSKKELNCLRWEKIAFIPQAAMGALNPVYRIGDQIVEAIMAHRNVRKRVAWERGEEVLKQVQLDPSWARRYPHELSGGMRQRVAIAMALVLDPELVIADEPTTALDVLTQAHILKLIKKLQKERNLSIVIISHDLSVLAQTCDRVMIMYGGVLVEMAKVGPLFNAPQHPYTQGLVGSFPDLKRPKMSLSGLGGRPPTLLASPMGCRFRPRCLKDQSTCRGTEPDLTEVRPEHHVRCHLFNRE